MKENTNKDKKYIVHKIFATISFILSTAYLSYFIVKNDSILTHISALSIAIFIFLISFALFISALRTSNKGAIYIVISLILMMFLGFNFLTDAKIILLPQEEKMTSYVNKTYSSLSDWAKNNNIEIVTEYEYSDEIEKGNIIRTDVNEGTFLKDIKKITVTVSDGPNYDKLLIIPSMLGWNVDDALEYINKNFMINVTFNYEESDSEKDIIFKQSKNGELRRNSELILTVSTGNIDDLPTNIEMIDLKNKTLFEATLWLKRNNIKYELKYEYSEKDKNIVLNQNIEKDKEINTETDTIVLTISKGKAIEVPDLTKMTVKEITDWVIENNLKVEFKETYDEETETGHIIKQDIAAGEKVATETLITVTISKGQIKMQSFSSLFEFKEWANKYNIKYSESYEYSSSVDKGKVISYSYKENEIVNPDAVIYVKVSLGKSISIPSFIGKTKIEAQNICNNLGIKCSFKIGTYTNYNKNTVYSQSRNIGTRVASGSTITLTLSLGVPTTWKLAILQNELSIGNADGTINSLKNAFANRYPGVKFVFQKKKDNTYNSGLVSPSSPTKVGSLIKQGNTYTIYIVSN